MEAYTTVGGARAWVREAITEDFSVQHYWWPQPALKQMLFQKPLQLHQCLESQSTQYAGAHLGAAVNHSCVLCAQVCLKLPVGSNGLSRLSPFQTSPVGLTLTDSSLEQMEKGVLENVVQRRPGRGRQRCGFDCRQPFIPPFTIGAGIQIL